MKISFPYMGCTTGYKKIFELLGHEVIAPSKPTQRTIDLGVLYSPEFICFPFKVMLGTYIEACERGAQVIISSGGSGPCRAGLYCEIHKRVLRELGYNAELIIFDSPFASPKEFLDKLRRLKNKTPFPALIKKLLFTYKMIKQMDSLEKQRNIERAYEITPGDYDKCWEKIVRLHEKCNTVAQLKAAGKESRSLFKEIPRRIFVQQQRMRIGIIGEIFVVMESTTNQNIESRLNRLGAEVYNTQYISEWVTHSFSKKIPFSKRYKLYKAASAYKEVACGGHDMENVGNIIEFKKMGFDAIVHIHPFGCLPELVTRTMIPQISEDLGMPILSLSVDEMTGEANTQTRLEAFAELVAAAKKVPGAAGKDEIFSDNVLKQKVEIYN